MKFFIMVCVLYVIYFIFNQGLVMSAIAGTGKMFYRLLPILALVFFIQVITNLYLTKERVGSFLGHQSGRAGWLYSAVAGILVTGPPYILYPLLSDLKKKGMKKELMAVFLYNRNVSPPFIPIMIFYFGLAFTFIISVYIVLFSVLNGILISRFVKNY